MSDALLERGLDEIVPTPEEFGDWNDVLQRAGVRVVSAARPRRRLRRRRVVIALAVLIFLVVPAVALIAAVATRTYVLFSHAKPAASNVVKKDFFGLTPAHLAGGLSLAAGAREVGTFRVDGRLMSLSVAPTIDGGYCFAIEHAEALCVPGGFKPLWVNYRGFTRSGIAAEFAGTITDARATTIEANYKDGSHDDVPFIYVSPPINAGFFIFGVPKEHQSRQRGLVAVTALDKNGHVLARQPINVP